MDVLSRVALLGFLAFAGCQGGETLVLEESEGRFIGVVPDGENPDESCVVAEEELVEFGPIEVGDGDLATVALFNVCDEPVTVLGVFVDPDHEPPAFSFDPDRPLPYTLDSEEGAELTFAFEPTDEGTFEAGVGVVVNDGVVELFLVGEAF